MSLQTIIGQEHIKSRLRRIFADGAGHAYLFSGPLGMGKKAIAKVAAKGILCASPNEDGACGKCDSCIYMESGTHPDFKELTIPAGEKMIKVDTVRTRVCADVQILPQISDYKVYMLEGDGLNEQGQNALLKTLEEPPPGVVFLITGTDESRFLPTIISRVELMNLLPNTQEELLLILRKNTQLTDDKAVFYARFSDGIPGRALSLSESLWFGVLRKEAIEAFFSLFEKSMAEKMVESYAFFEENKEHVPEILAIWQLMLRDISILFFYREEETVVNSDYKEQMLSFLNTYGWTAADADRATAVLARTISERKVNCSFESMICEMLISL